MRKIPESGENPNMPQTKFLLATVPGALVALSALVAQPARASDAPTYSPLTSNISVVSNYIYRGVSRTNNYPAVQGGVDLSLESGYYVGAWGSNVSWLQDRGLAKASSLELDAYAGYKDSFATNFNYDLGLLRYHFPAVYNANAINADSTEAYAGLGFKWLSMKYSYSIGNMFGVMDSKGTHYVDISANFPFPDEGVTLSAHWGRQTFKGAGAEALKLAGADPSYSDIRLGVSYNLEGYIFGLSYINTSKNESTYYTSVQGGKLRRETALFSFRRTF